MKTVIGTDLPEAKRWLEMGETVAIPTETVYGLAANALSNDAVVKIFEVKQRPTFNPLIVHLPSIASLKDYAAEVPEMAWKLAEKFSPGPLTFVLPKKNNIPDLVTAGGTSVALRIPDHPVALELLRSLPFPLAAPSANPFGYISPVNARHVYDQLQGKIPYILDGGTSAIGLESTVICFEEGKVIVLRLGGVSVEELEAVAGKVELHINQSSDPKSPGQLKSHYAPKHPLYLGRISKNLERFRGQKIGILSFEKTYPDIPSAQQIQLSATGNLLEAARNLFTAMRALDVMDLDIILAEELPEIGLGRAVNDRLQRAAAEG